MHGCISTIFQDFLVILKRYMMNFLPTPVEKNINHDTCIVNHIFSTASLNVITDTNQLVKKSIEENYTNCTNYINLHKLECKNSLAPTYIILLIQYS